MLMPSAPSELAHQINDSGATAIFLAPSHIAAFDEARPLLKASFPTSRVILLCEPSSTPAGYQTVWDILPPPQGTYTAQRFDRADAQTTAWLCYSSGTTGLPKGVMTSHFNITSQVQAGNIGFQRMKPNRDVVLGFIPYSHIYGAVIGLLQPISQGAAVVVLPRFEEVPVLEAIQRVSDRGRAAGQSVPRACQGRGLRTGMLGIHSETHPQNVTSTALPISVDVRLSSLCPNVVLILSIRALFSTLSVITFSSELY